jgi:hypothetical protein
MLEGGVAANERKTLEPRARYPIKPRGRRRRVKKPSVLELTRLRGRDHLPLVRLRDAA